MRILSRKRFTCQSGFTLVEIIVAVAVFSILAGIGTTMLLNALPNMRIKSAAREVYSAIMQTKNEAIRRGENVTLLFNSPGNTFVMFLDRRPSPAFPADPANDDDGQLDPNETVIVPSTGFQTNVAFDPTIGGDGITLAGNALVFTMRGIPTGAGTVGLQATDNQGVVVRQRSITISAAGRVNVQ